MLLMKGKLTDLEFMKDVDADMDRVYRLNAVMQHFIRELHELGHQPLGAENIPAGPPTFKPLFESFGLLLSEADGEELKQLIRHEVELAEKVAVSMFWYVASRISSEVDEDTKINPYAISLQPERWESDGLFDPNGMSMADAREAVGSVEYLFQTEIPAPVT